MLTGLLFGLVIAFPVILGPAFFVWYLNVGGLAGIRADLKAKLRETIR